MWIIITGIGNIPDTVLASLWAHRDIGVHTEMFSDGLVDLVEKGVITNARKKVHQGKIVGGFCLGTRRLYDFIDNNPSLGRCCIVASMFGSFNLYVCL